MSTHVGITRTLYLLALAGTGARARQEIAELASEDDVAAARSTLVTAASADIEAAASRARDNGRELEVLAGLARTMYPVVAIPVSVVERIVAHLESLRTSQWSTTCPEGVNGLLADIQRVLLRRAQLMENAPVAEQLQALGSIFALNDGNDLTEEGHALQLIASQVKGIAEVLLEEADDANDALDSETYESDDLEEAERGLRGAALLLAGTSTEQGEPPKTPEPDDVATSPAGTRTAVGTESTAYFASGDAAYALNEQGELVTCDLDGTETPNWANSTLVDFDRCDRDQLPFLNAIKAALQFETPAQRGA